MSLEKGKCDCEESCHGIAASADVDLQRACAGALQLLQWNCQPIAGLHIMAPGIAKQPMQNGNASLDHLQPDDDDLLYEEELLRNPYSLKMWWRYLEARRDSPARKRYILYERALKALPVSYKVSCLRSLKMSTTCRLPSQEDEACSLSVVISVQKCPDQTSQRGTVMCRNGPVSSC